MRSAEDHRFGIRNDVISVVAVIQKDLEYPRCGHSCDLTANRLNFLILNQLQRPQPGTVDHQIGLPISQQTVQAINPRPDKPSSHVNEPIEQIRQQPGWFAGERGKVIPSRIAASVFVTQPVQFCLGNFGAPVYDVLPGGFRVAGGIGREACARLETDAYAGREPVLP